MASRVITGELWLAKEISFDSTALNTESGLVNRDIKIQNSEGTILFLMVEP